MATPVINQPQVAILDTEAVVKRPVVVTDELGNDSIAIRTMTYLCMSWDHRALDGALAARFLRALADGWRPGRSATASAGRSYSSSRAAASASPGAGDALEQVQREVDARTRARPP